MKIQGQNEINLQGLSLKEDTKYSTTVDIWDSFLLVCKLPRMGFSFGLVMDPTHRNSV